MKNWIIVFLVTFVAFYLFRQSDGSALYMIVILAGAAIAERILHYFFWIKTR